jgi:hypothetical protein
MAACSCFQENGVHDRIRHRRPRLAPAPVVKFDCGQRATPRSLWETVCHHRHTRSRASSPPPPCARAGGIIFSCLYLLLSTFLSVVLSLLPIRRQPRHHHHRPPFASGCARTRRPPRSSVNASAMKRQHKSKTNLLVQRSGSSQPLRGLTRSPTSLGTRRTFEIKA